MPTPIATNLLSAISGSFPCRLLAVLIAAAMVTIMPGMAPEPDPAPRRWQLAIEPGALRVASVEVAGKGRLSYFYFTYKVTNGSGNDLLFAPSFDLGVDAGGVRRSGRDVPAEVTKQVLADLENKDLQDQIGIVGMLPQGEENAKEGVVIWPVNETHLAEVSVYAAGFSGEMRTVSTKDAKTGKTSTTTVRKTLMLRFQAPGDLQNVGPDPLPLVEQRWIMR
ncbi:MAG: hypothetical protein WCK33_00640 [Phycisphaerae bacterium]|jgi:hypothetical protein